MGESVLEGMKRIVPIAGVALLLGLHAMLLLENVMILLAFGSKLAAVFSAARVPASPSTRTRCGWS